MVLYTFPRNKAFLAISHLLNKSAKKKKRVDVNWLYNCAILNYILIYIKRLNLTPNNNQFYNIYINLDKYFDSITIS